MRANQLICVWLLMLISIFSVDLWAQENDTSRLKLAVNKQDTPKEKVNTEKEKIKHDLRLGIDISTLISGAITPVRRGLDLSVEYNWTPKLFLMLEGGYQYFQRENIRVEYISKGNYIRLGFDYNVRNAVEKNDYDIYYLGARIGYSRFSQEVPFYLLNNDFWGNSSSSIGEVDNYAYWAEFVTGFKVEVLKNWFLGMGLRLKMFIKRNKNTIEPVQFVPGYARNYNSAVADFNYTIYYNIPLNYKKEKQLVYERKE
jgi:hypothetical protein